MIIRNLLLTLSESRALTGIISRCGVFSRLAHRFVAGETLQETIDEIKVLNKRGIKVTIDHLGENVEDRKSAEEATEVYLDILDAIEREDLDANISLKLTQLGLDIGIDLCRQNLLRIARKARESGNFVRVDMENSEYTDRTLDVFESTFAESDNTGIVIQSYLYRSEEDVVMINGLNARVRLCKGAYREPRSVAFPRKQDVDSSFLSLARLLLVNGRYPAIATHDVKMIDGTKALAKEVGASTEDFEFQMLYGIRRDLQVQLAEEGYTVRVYIAYGSKWAPYFMRRLAERPANAFFLLKNLLMEKS